MSIEKIQDNFPRIIDKEDTDLLPIEEKPEVLDLDDLFAENDLQFDVSDHKLPPEEYTFEDFHCCKEDGDTDFLSPRWWIEERESGILMVDAYECKFTWNTAIVGHPTLEGPGRRWIRG
ncbi:uncharacterized protein LOC141904364 [Tubulanus polymorphus]|uniref:uncharacterized protein LOC141904364 n=1 Tax=Tubulanus polymorphus TaxID=672921 RepID=UPI003DA3A48F